MKKIIAALGLSTLLALPAQAKIYFDQEVEPLPLIDLTVVIPVGFESATPQEAGSSLLLGDLFDGGTSQKTKQQFLDALGAYGADVDFSVSNQYSYLKLNFPVVDGKDYSGLTALIHELWASPRIDAQNFEIAKTKLSASLKSALDNDESLEISTLRRWVNKKAFGGFPLFLDKVPEIKLETVKTVYERDFLKIKDIWVGAVAPAKNADLVKQILTGVFKDQGSLEEGKYWKQLSPLRAPTPHFETAKKLFFILDKAGRAQSVTSFMAPSAGPLKSSEELPFLFGNHLLVDAGIGSYFNEEIRTKRGLAYSIYGLSRNYLGAPVLGFGTNPVKEKSKEAFEVMHQLVGEAYGSGDLFEKLPDDFWQRQWKSFQYGKILSQATAEQRLEERMSVVIGGTSARFAQSDPASWSVNRKEVKELFAARWKQSQKMGIVVGNAAELKPLVEKNFPDFELKVIPYKDSILSTTY